MGCRLDRADAIDVIGAKLPDDAPEAARRAFRRIARFVARSPGPHEKVQVTTKEAALLVQTFEQRGGVF